MKAAIAHSRRLVNRVRQLQIVHSPQSHLTSFDESAEFAISPCSMLFAVVLIVLQYQRPRSDRHYGHLPS